MRRMVAIFSLSILVFLAPNLGLAQFLGGWGWPSIQATPSVKAGYQNLGINMNFPIPPQDIDMPPGVSRVSIFGPLICSSPTHISG